MTSFPGNNIVTNCFDHRAMMEALVGNLHMFCALHLYPYMYALLQCSNAYMHSVMHAPASFTTLVILCV